MAKVRLMYWKEIPAQVQAWDDRHTISKPLGERFQAGIDAIAMFDGSYGSDDYLSGWNWGEETEVEGSTEEVAALWVQRIEGRFPRDFVARVQELHASGRRDPRPGAVDHWMDEGNSSLKCRR